jgi:hypothetical protein
MYEVLKLYPLHIIVCVFNYTPVIYYCFTKLYIAFTTSPTSGGRSVGIVRLPTTGHGFFFFILLRCLCYLRTVHDNATATITVYSYMQPQKLTALFHMISRLNLEYQSTGQLKYCNASQIRKLEEDWFH